MNREYKMDLTETFFQPGDSHNVAYSNVRDCPNLVEEKGEIEALWRWFRDQGLEEAGFRRNAMVEFYSCLWEMDLANMLVNFGFAVERLKNGGPDFRASKEGLRLLFEAIVPQMGIGEDRVSEVVTGAPVAQKVPQDQMVLRFLNALRTKLDQYEKAAIAEPALRAEPYIVALNGCDIGHGALHWRIPYIVKAVFPIGLEVVSIDPVTHKMDGNYFVYRPEIRKRSGSDVDSGVFLNEAYAPVSAVLYSEGNPITWSLSRASDFVLVHNPLANYPVDQGFFGIGKEYWWDDGALNCRDHKAD